MAARRRSGASARRALRGVLEPGEVRVLKSMVADEAYNAALVGALGLPYEDDIRAAIARRRQGV